MSRNPFPTTQMQNLWKETIEKEAHARLMAFNRLRGKPRTRSNHAEVVQHRRDLNKQALLTIQLPDIPETRHPMLKTEFVMASHSVPPDDACDDLQDVGMRPVLPLVKDTLYEGYSKLGRGRKLYLRMRNDKKPEDKFIYPLCSSWEYGWRLRDALGQDGLQRPKYASYAIIEDTFYSNQGTGVVHDGCVMQH
ncbi:unnamed protein product [Lymnaea stagnalis]|uniref:Sperm microtubule inner protein 1 C-terminal domain-containing protein n=1 Tax=Lymnaea stagnalis TaxID=6523 RepID=A0AAV2IIU7_LYMST